MKVLSISSEAFPLMKTGGLGDVAGALPLALAAKGVQTKTLLPGYPAIMKAVSGLVKIYEFDNLLGEQATLWETRYKGLDLLILDAPGLFDRPGGPYMDAAGKDFEDNWRRFAIFSLAGARIAAGCLPDWKPAVLHAHDWQTALTPVYMRYAYELEIPSVLTIHNIAFQGQFSSDIFPALGLPRHAFWESMEYYGDVGFLKGGLQTATAITTVSPSYAEEILYPQFGMGLEGLIRLRAGSVHGIVNGIDTDVWNPETDTFLARNYSARTISQRVTNRQAVAARFGLHDDDSPLFCVISRLTWQKGMDLLADTVDHLVGFGGRLAVLGSGDPALEHAFLAAAARHPGRVGAVIGYNEALSHLIQSGSDAILIPSRFEPCGLTQLYALRYGCVPVVARTGGLNDTVIDATHAALAAGSATGIQFTLNDANSLLYAYRRVFKLYEDQKLWTKVQKQGMKTDVSWDASADAYVALYSNLVAKGH
ncbi:glycogen synthase GlgA [Rhizobiaceae bacterium BDR2-2]|uniref:Glycogen synthase n=1 Tax=Ectorhizobium quercum TaxID=2965071 RepID=A0AAE3MYK6_9HYPH|nr:glycogen synthase GlgA [Ectorhizobium quercum]MCX8996851.1 glycogen synthase GlgA [Ectorhizobium quercum]